MNIQIIAIVGPICYNTNKRMHNNNEATPETFKVMVPMRFRLGAKAAALKNKHNSLLEAVKVLNPLAAIQQTQPVQEELGLRFCKKVSEQHLLIGNQYQLSLLDFTHAKKGYSEISSLWNIEHSDKISAIFLLTKIQKIFVVFHSYIRCYGYRQEFIESPPVYHFQIKFQSKVDALYSPKRNTLLVFAGNFVTAFQMYNQHDAFKISKLMSKAYKKQRKDLSFLELPQNQGETIAVFFEQLSNDQNLDEAHRIKVNTVYWLRIKLNAIKDMEITEIAEYSTIPTYVSTNEPQFQLRHYKQGIFLFLKGCELFAIRNSYIIDKLKLSYTKNQSFTSYASKDQLLYYENGSLDLYQFSLNESRKPQKMALQCLNTTIFQKPAQSTCFALQHLQGRLIAIYHQKKVTTNNEFLYWVGISHHADKKQKMREIFGDKDNDGEKLQNQLFLAQKIGIMQNEAFLQIWNRCPKTSKKDYELLIATEDYTMIQEEIQRKFKKNSIRFHQISLVLRSSLEMLRHKVKHNCSVQAIRQLSVCHFLCCKIEMFEKQQRQTLKEGQDLYITIQDYYYLMNIELEKDLMDLLGQLCVERKPVKIKIRAMLTQFSLIFRMLYHQLLPKFVKTLKQHFLTLLSEIPEILPVPPKKGQDSQNDLNKGPWASIDLQASNDYLILSQHSNFQTESYFSQFISSKFFKVYQWHSHAAINRSKKEIQKIIKQNDNNHIFTLLFQVLYEQKDKIGEGNLKKIIQNVEQYELLPERLKGKFYFLCKLYQIFKDYFLAEKCTFFSTFEFFSLSEDELFLLYFKKERAKKGIFILKEIKPIYEELAAEGGELFIKNMFNFFKTEDSSWSDLKIILNKFNNEKQDFHEGNYNIFEVIVSGLMEKIRIGTQNPAQIGLEEVIAYLENIPFPLQQGDLLNNLYAITQIHEEQPLLKKLKINMNLRSLLQRGEEVIFKMVQYEIERNQITQITEQNELVMMAYKVLADIGEKQAKIYVDKHFNFAYKSFLIILMEEERFIFLCQPLIYDQFLRNTFKVDNKLIENIVLYLYRKRLYQNPNYSDSKEFINRLVQLIEPSSAKAMFIVLSEAFAKIFTFQRFKVQYPFFMGYYPTVAEIEVLINSLNRQEVEPIDFKNLFEVTFMLKLLGQQYENIQETKTYAFTNRQGLQKKNRLQHEIYTIVLMKFIKQGLLSRAIELVVNILKIKTENRVFNIIFPIFLIQILQKELLLRAQEPILRLISHYFYSHTKFLNIVIDLTNGLRFSNDEIDDFIADKQKQKAKYLIIDPNNLVFSEPFKRFLNSIQPGDQVKVVNEMFQTVWRQISCRREEFKLNYIYNIMFRILLHDPFVLAQYIYRKQTGINVKSLRALFTLLGFEAVFNMSALFKVCKAVFEALMTKLQSTMLLGDVLQNYKQGSKFSQELFYTEEYLDTQVKLTAQDLLGSSIMIMNQKLTCLQRNPQIEKDEEKKSQEIQQLRYRPEIYLKRKEEQSQVILQKLYPNQFRKKNTELRIEILKKSQYPEYPFNDQDHSYTDAKYDLDIPLSTYAPSRSTFDEVTERSEKALSLIYARKLRVKQSSDGEGTAQFDELYQNKFLMKTRSQKNQGHLQRKSSSKSIQNEQQFRMQDVFKSKCIEGGFLSMLQSKPKASKIYQRNLLGFPQIRETLVQEFPLDQSQFLESFEVQSESKLSRAVTDYLSRQQPFDPVFLPQLKKDEKPIFLQNLLPQIYSQREYSYSRRIDLIYLIKGYITGKDARNEVGYKVLKRAAASQEIDRMLTPVQDLLTEPILTDNFDEETIIQIVKEQAAEYVIHQQDFTKVASFVGEVFNSNKLAEDIKVVFLLKLSRKYLKSSDEAKRHIKDEILFLASSIPKVRMEECIAVHRNSKNPDVRQISHLLQSVLHLCMRDGPHTSRTT